MIEQKFRNTIASVALILSIAAISITRCGNMVQLPVSEEIPQTAIEDTTKSLSIYQVTPLSDTTVSNTQEGSVKYGAVIELGSLDELGRSTYAHIRVSDAQEPGTNGEERDERISVDPAGWFNWKENGDWIMNRCHLVGYQFSGLNNELRNLAPGTAYLNKGTQGNGTDENNPDGMLFYEQRLDTWLHENQSCSLDLYVRPVYEDGLVPTYFYMQWVGISPEMEFLPIDTGGSAEPLGDNIYGVLLQNVDQKKQYVRK